MPPMALPPAAIIKSCLGLSCVSVMSNNDFLKKIVKIHTDKSFERSAQKTLNLLQIFSFLFTFTFPRLIGK